MFEKPRKSLSLSFPGVPIVVWRFLAFLGSANFVAFLFGSYALGGDALTGRTDVAYYVGNHGQYTQVSELVYWLSYLHGLSTMLGFALAALAAWRLERLEDPVFRRWKGPFGTIVFGTGFAGVVAWSFGLPARVVIPTLVALAAIALIACFLDLRGRDRLQEAREAVEQADAADKARG